ncbi:MAG: beta-galactosidase [Terracidiphilus sp.]|nr:beta-galactosidase [Terracidiphilus sp.]
MTIRSHFLFRLLPFAAPVLAAGLCCTVCAETPVPDAPHILTASGDHFALDGRPFQIISGAIHYPRVPRAYWRDRLKKARAMGLNTVETYVFWNVHEPTPGHYVFSGENDVAEFVREAQQEGLFVILRPGPYVCAEWEFGGYPAWLLKEPTTKVRTQDPKFMEPASRWLHRLGQELAPLQSANGGPIIAVQVENEYGSFGNDHAYMEKMHQILLDSGFDKAMLYTADGADELPDGALPELPAVINFGSGEAKNEFPKLEKLRPTGPRMNGEYWDGWFDHWGGRHHTTDPRTEAEELKWMLGKGYSVNLYMVHGGTSFGWMNGANIDGGKYEPDVTSYDYDVPIAENGALREKYFLFRDAIRSVTGVTPPEPPPATEARSFAPVTLEAAAPLWAALPKPVESEQILSMEQVDQSYGYILYRTTLPNSATGTLKIDELHSYAQVYVDGKLAETLDRRLGQSTLTIESAQAEARLDILVENTGRVNYGKQFPGERAGITKSVLLNEKELRGWRIYPLPMDKVDSLGYSTTPCDGACFLRGTLIVDKPADTFVDMRGFGKGEVFVNGRALGRFWSIGPQQTLYLPAPWLHAGKNEVVVFDLETRTPRKVQFLDKAILDDNSTHR